LEGESGCSPDKNERWECGELDDGDECLEMIYSACQPEEQCDAGSCVPDNTCEDECIPDETGCSVDGSSRWTCDEADDDDICLDRVFVPCKADEVCFDGVCSPQTIPCTDECSMGEQACIDQTNYWHCGEALDGDNCLDKMYGQCYDGFFCDEGMCITAFEPPADGDYSGDTTPSHSDVSGESDGSSSGGGDGGCSIGSQSNGPNDTAPWMHFIALYLLIMSALRWMKRPT